jgi:hypothetical protein
MNWNYAYDEKNQVKQAWKKFTASNSNAVVTGTQSQYAYDGIGNRTTLDEGGIGTTTSTAPPNWTQGLRQTIYTADALNQYTQIQRPQTFDVTGKRSNTTATITINDPSVPSASTPPQNIAHYFYFVKLKGCFPLDHDYSCMGLQSPFFG